MLRLSASVRNTRVEKTAKAGAGRKDVNGVTSSEPGGTSPTASAPRHRPTAMPHPHHKRHCDALTVDANA